MTSIEQLQLSGIRSFDPDPTRRQTLYFQKPLTVILGKNGAGKTTIIEALLNACTGAMPPGSGAEKSSFVYDPKVIGESEVKAQIRFIFTGKGGKVMQVIRSFQASRTRNKVSFATLDNTVAYQDAATGKVISNTYRSSDVDRVVPEMLGVSSAVLEHVIFCHQEDCNWPLAPPKDVKRIFDDIFAATRYVLALDRLRENSKELRRQQKEHESSLMALRDHREQAAQLEGDIARKEDLVKSIQTRNTSIEPELLELKKTSAALDGAEQNIDALTREAAQIQGRMEEKRETIHRTNVTDISHSLHEMLELRCICADQIKHAQEEVTQKAQQLATAQQSARQCEEEVYLRRSQIQIMEQIAEEHKRECAELQQVLQSFSAEFVEAGGLIDESSLTRVMTAVEQRLQQHRLERQTSLQQIADDIAREEDALRVAARDLDLACNEERVLNGALEELSSRAEEAGLALKELGGDDCQQQLVYLRGEVQKLERCMEAAEGARQKTECYQQRQHLLAEFERQNAVVCQLRQEIVSENQRSAGKNEMSALRQQLEARSCAFAKAFKEDVRPRLTLLQIDIDDESSFAGVVYKAEKLRDQQKDFLLSSQEELAAVERARVTLQEKKSSLAEQLAHVEAELEHKLSQCTAVLGPGGDIELYDRVLSEARSAAEELLRRRHKMETMAVCYQDFVEDADKTKRCTLCERPFADSEALQHFIEMNNTRRKVFPEAAENVLLELQKAQDRLQHLEAIQQVVEDVRQLRAARIPHIEAAFKEVEAQLAQSAACRADVEARHACIEQRAGRLQELYWTLAGLRTLDTEVQSLKSQLARREKHFDEAEHCDNASPLPTNAMSAKSYEELLASYEAATARLHWLNQRIGEAQQIECGTSLDDLAKELLDKRSAMLWMEVTVDKVNYHTAALERYTEEQQKNRSRLHAIQIQCAEMRRTLTEVEGRLSELRGRREDLERQTLVPLEHMEHQARLAESIVPKVLDYVRGGRAKQLDSAREHLKAAESSCQQALIDVTALSKELDDARRRPEEHSRRLIEMDRMIEVLELQQSLAADGARLKNIETSLSDLKNSQLQGVRDLLGEQAGAESLPRLRELIRAKISELERLQAQQEGNVEAILQDICNLKNQLGRDKYHNIEKRYRSTFLKLQTTEMAVRDIDKYYNALEKAVQSYHHEKIAQINQLISDLWRQTYRGSDIDTVEIRSETETTSSTSARRSYNYRVVMRRGNSEIDMRGRCSAGQKVLASVIIRLALSEAFCCECGILALDEPTTNLDEDNARSLAEALRVLIQSRRTIKHFQLIVITHDEQFVRALGGRTLDRFYYIHKDREGAFSVIEERTFDQLFA